MLKCHIVFCALTLLVGCQEEHPVCKIRKPRKGAVVIAASMHGFANCWKFKSLLILTLTLDWVKVTPTYTVCVGLPACPTM